ncbi:MAG: hypothetical protein M0R37_13755 [Bacteroidales bacterium]|jgi:type IV pilus biogenesis protein CpaD/CtpE|nr:hypothetical protein [Bacteroidales bacterium]
MAAGDLTYIEQAGVITLNAAQRTALTTFVDSVWNGAIANVLGISAWRDSENPATVMCAVMGKRKVAPAALPLGVQVIERE